MIRIEYEIYYNDCNKRYESKTFGSLTDLENWIFSQMKIKYQNDYWAMYFPDEEPSRIVFSPEYGGASNWIHMIQNDVGIIFSDGKMTCGQKHMNEEIRSWLKHCRERQNKPQFNFV